MKSVATAHPSHEATIGARTAMSARTCVRELAEKAVLAPVRRWFLVAVREVQAGSSFVVLFITLLVCPCWASATDSTSLFDTANRLYAEGRFTEAASAYEKILESGQASPALYFNLGNAFFKSGQMGRAIAAYRQAGRLTPRDPDLRANLQFARNQVQGPTLRVGRWERWFGTLSLNEWTWLGVIAIWLTFALLTVRELRPALARSLRNWTFAAGATAVLLVFCAALAFAAGSTRKLAIIVLPEAAVRSSPLEGAPNAFTVRDGAELRVLDQKDDWLQVTDGARRLGWLKRDAALLSGHS